MYRTILLILLAFYGVSVDAQVIQGVVVSESDDSPIDFAVVYLNRAERSTETDGDGEYQILLEAGYSDSLRVTRVGFEELQVFVPALQPGQVYELNLRLVPDNNMEEVVIEEKRLDQDGMIVEDVSDFEGLPNTTGNIESLLPHISLGVSSGTGGELSSQYNVRGGNYDENIVMVNDFEIYRPQLITNSQQEGLSFVNLDLVQNVSFSSGGFSSRYGDKMSSVMDVKYKLPEETRGSVTLGMLGAAAHLEGSKYQTHDHKGLRYLLGARYRSNAYLLNSQDLKGEYDPRFMDIQAMLTYDFGPQWSLSYLGNFNRSVFAFSPENSEANIGTLTQTRRLFVDYKGGEESRFTNSMNGLSMTHLRRDGSNTHFYKLLLSVTRINESENFDIIGDYSLAATEAGVSANAGEVIGLVGQGVFQRYTKNYFDATILGAQLRSGHEYVLENSNELRKINLIEWGIGVKQEELQDVVRIWERLDSAGYSLPHSQDDDAVLLDDFSSGRNHLTSLKYNLYLSNKYEVIQNRSYRLSAELGARFHYWDANEELFVNPRFQVLYKPLSWQRDMSFKFAGGLYYQPPFYREMRTLQGDLNEEGIVSQKSAQLVMGMTYDFKSKKRNVPYRLQIEAYYKSLEDLISYDVDNVRILYTGENDASGYAYGVDARLNGELIPNAESWVNVSFLKTSERLDGIDHYRVENRGEAGLDTISLDEVPRPSDRRLEATFFFQDYLPNNENIRMNMKLVVGSGLPYGFPGDNRVVRNDLRIRPYYRLDLGLSFVLFDENNKRASRNQKHFLSFTSRTWLDIGLFNLLDVANVASYSWIRDFGGLYYSIPNNLTSRRVNVQFKMEF